MGEKADVGDVPEGIIGRGGFGFVHVDDGFGLRMAAGPVSQGGGVDHHPARGVDQDTVRLHLFEFVGIKSFGIPSSKSRRSSSDIFVSVAIYVSLLLVFIKEDTLL